MRLFYAISGSPSDLDAICSHGEESVYALCAFPYRSCMKSHKPRAFKDFIADSGAFTAMNTGMDIDADYVDAYAKWIIDEGIENYVELDLDEIIGVEQTRKLTESLEARIGRKSMPCWHCERGADGWLRMCDEYDYVCISLSGFTKTSKWLKANGYKPLEWFLRTARERGAKVHALGCTSVPLLSKYRFYSADSSTYAIGARFGTVLEYRNGKIKSQRPNAKFKKDRTSILKSNIEEMRKLADYAEKHW